jgi:hypothetical protein
LINLTNILTSRSAAEARESRIQGERKKDVQFPRPEKVHGGKPKTISQKARPKGAHCPSMTPLTINFPLKLTVLEQSEETELATRRRRNSLAGLRDFGQLLRKKSNYRKKRR